MMWRSIETALLVLAQIQHIQVEDLQLGVITFGNHLISLTLNKIYKELTGLCIKAILTANETELTCPVKRLSSKK